VTSFLGVLAGNNAGADALPRQIAGGLAVPKFTDVSEPRRARSLRQFHPGRVGGTLMTDCWITRRGCTLATEPKSKRRLAAGGKRGIPVETRIPASERTSQKLNELLTQDVAEGDARSELIKLDVRKIVEEALEAEVGEAVGRGYY
jgi:hypothetical protein